MELSGGDLKPGFDPDTTTCAVAVDVDTATSAVTLETRASPVTVAYTIGGTALTDADDTTDAFDAYIVSGGDTVITVTVTAGNGTTIKTYTVRGERPARPTAPDAPEIIALNPGDNSLTVAWSAPANNVGGPITAYDVRWAEVTDSDDPAAAAWTTARASTSARDGTTRSPGSTARSATGWRSAPSTTSATVNGPNLHRAARTSMRGPQPGPPSTWS